MIVSDLLPLVRLRKKGPTVALADTIVASSLHDLPRVLEANLKWHSATGDLIQWVHVLNRFDEIFEGRIDTYDLAAEHPRLQEMLADDERLLVACLRFTKLLLTNCINRNIYASSERIYQLVDTCSVDVKLVAMEVALCLGERYVQSSLNKKNAAPKPVRLRVLETAKAYPPPIPASFIQSRIESERASKKLPQKKLDHYSLVDTLDLQKPYPSKWKSLNFEYYNTKGDIRKPRGKERKLKFLKAEEGCLTFSLSEEQVRKLSLQQIYDKAAECLPSYTWPAFTYAALNAKAFNTNLFDSLALRSKLLRVKCLAIAFVCCTCNTDFTSYQLFEVEPYTLSFLMDLISPENIRLVSNDIFYIALKTIRAISLKRVWGSEIVRHLGGSVNHGLLYQVLRYINKQVRLNADHPFEDGFKVFLTILCNLVDLKTLAPRLVAGGLLSELMAFMDIRTENRWSGSSAVHIIAILLSSSPELVEDFANNDGFSLLVDTVTYEVNFAIENPGFLEGAPDPESMYHTISLRQVKYLRNLLNFVSNLILSEAGDRLRNLIDSPLLASFNTIILHPTTFGPIILAATIDDVAQIIHNEPTAYSILEEEKVIDTILGNYSNLFLPSGELYLSLLEVLGAIVLNNNGLAKVVESKAIETFLNKPLDLKLAKELVASDMSTNIGCSLDELGRHNPALRPIISAALKKMVEGFALKASSQLKSIEFYNSDSGSLYRSSLEEKGSSEEDEILSWENIEGSDLFESLFAFLNGLLQDAGQWGKELTLEIDYSAWLSFVKLPYVPYDFTMSNAMANLVSMLKCMEGTYHATGFTEAITSTTLLLDSKTIQQFLAFSGDESFFATLQSSSHTNQFLVHLNSLNSLLYFLTEIFLSPVTAETQTVYAFFDFLESNMSFIHTTIQLLEACMLEEIRIRRTLPDEINLQTMYTAPYEMMDSGLNVRPSAPGPESPGRIPNCAKAKNTLQIRFLVNMMQHSVLRIFNCMTKSCMHRRQDFFTYQWRKSAVVALRHLALGTEHLLERRKLLTEGIREEYELAAITHISTIATFKDRGKPAVCTSLAILFFHTTTVVEDIVNATRSMFRRAANLPSAELEEVRDLTYIKSCPASIAVHFLKTSVLFLTKILTPSNLPKIPFWSMFYHREYCSNESAIMDGFSALVAEQIWNLISFTIGSQSSAYLEDDFSVFGRLPTDLVESLVYLLRLVYHKMPVDEYYPLNEDFMSPATSEIEFLQGVLGVSFQKAVLILEFSKSVSNIQSITPRAVEKDFPDWPEIQSKLEDREFDYNFEPVITNTLARLSKIRETEEQVVCPMSLLKLAALNTFKDDTVVWAIRDYEVLDVTVNQLFSLLTELGRDLSKDNLIYLNNLTALLRDTIGTYPAPVPGEVDGPYQRGLLTFLSFFLDKLKAYPELVDTDFFATGLSIIRPLLGKTPPNVPSQYFRHFPISDEGDLIKSRIASTVLTLEPKSNVKAVTAVSRFVFLLAKNEAYKQDVINSPLLRSIIFNMDDYLKDLKREDHKKLQDGVMLLIRSCFENKALLRSVMSTEIRKQFKRTSGGKRDIRHFVDESRFLIGRDPQIFLEEAAKVARLYDFDGDILSADKIYHVERGEFIMGSADLQEDVEMADTDEESIISAPLGIMHMLLNQLMIVSREDWTSTPENDEETKEKKDIKEKDELTFEALLENPKFRYLCFLLQTICELVGSYKEAKLEFITFSKKAQGEERNKPRLTSLNLFIHQLIPSYQLVDCSRAEFHRREAISSLAKVTLLALTSSIILPDDKEPDPRKEDPDMAIVRKLMVDMTARILKETAAEKPSSRTFSKIYDIFDLCSCLLSTKFKELTYPLISKTATKFDHFFIASAFLDAQLPNQITTVMSSLDLNYPDVSKVSNVGLRALTSLGKIKLANADLFEASTDKDDEDIEDAEDRDDTPDLFKNSTLGIYDIELASDEEEEYYQDHMIDAISASEESEDESDNSESMSDSDMDSDEDEQIDEGEDEDNFDHYGSEDIDDDIEIIEELDIHSGSGSEFDESEGDEFHGFDSDSNGDEEEMGDEEEEEDYEDANLDDWLEAFADPDELGSGSERPRLSERFGDNHHEESNEEFDSENESNSESEDERHADEPIFGSRTTRETFNNFFNSLPQGRPIVSLAPTGLLGGSIQIGNTRSSDTVFPQIDAAFQALLNESQPKDPFDYMFIRSTIERWTDAFMNVFHAVDSKLLEIVREMLKEKISALSLEIHRKWTEERDRILDAQKERQRKMHEELFNRIEEEKLDASDAEGESGENPPVMIWIGNREVDISGTDIDPEFFEALPEEMREEVFTQHIRERRANASSTGTEVREIDPDFLDALPDQIRDDILRQESIARRFSVDRSRHEDESVEELDYDGNEHDSRIVFGRPGDWLPTNEAPESEAPSKKKTFATPIIDRSGVASLVRLLFLPKPINQREQIYKAILLVCNNKQTRTEVVSMLIAILHDGLLTQKSLEKSFAYISSKAINGKPSDLASKSFPIGGSPITIGVQVIEAVLYLLEKNPALRMFLLSEHDNAFLAKKHLKKFRLKKTAILEEKYPINLLVRLLDNPLLSDEHFFIDLLANVLNFATRPLLALRNKSKSTVFKKNFVPESSLRLIVKILVSNECVNSTFRNTISAMHHLSLLDGAQDVLTHELSDKAGSLGAQVILDLADLAVELERNPMLDATDSKTVAKFTAASLDQAKILRVLTTLNYLYETSGSHDGEKSDIERLTGLYKDLRLGALWKALSDCLTILEAKPSMAHVATALLPLIEALMIVCKHSKVKELHVKDVMKYEVKKIDFTKEPIESLFFSFTDEHKKILNQMVRLNPNLMSGPFSMLVRNPRVLEFDNKRNYFNRQLHGTKSSSPKLSVSIRRDQVFLDSYRALFFKSLDEFKKAHLAIHFRGEAGVDAGGVTREWYQVLSRQMFNPDYALFTAVASDENTYHPNRTSYINPEHLSFFKFIGRIIGKAIFDGCFLDCHFSRAVYKKILDRPVSLKDMENLDLEYFKSLMWMLENDITDIITEDFSVESDDYGEHKIIDLVPNGRNIPVTEENKNEYVSLVVEYRLQTSVQEQMSNFITGFHEIIPRDLVAIFDEQELELLISGLPDIDVQDWQNNTVYNNYSASSEQIQWFWRAVKSFDNEERAKLLQFSTGTSKVPLNGFKDLSGANGVCKFSIHRDYGAKDRLPSSHTCFNQIDLPVYDSYEALRGSLLLAVSEGHEGFQLV